MGYHRRCRNIFALAHRLGQLFGRQVDPITSKPSLPHPARPPLANSDRGLRALLHHSRFLRSYDQNSYAAAFILLSQRSQRISRLGFPQAFCPQGQMNGVLLLVPPPLFPD